MHRPNSQTTLLLLPLPLPQLQTSALLLLLTLTATSINLSHQQQQQQQGQMYPETGEAEEDYDEIFLPSEERNDTIPHFESPSLSITGKVVPGQRGQLPADRVSNNSPDQTLDDLLLILVDAWWKILLWSLAALVLLCLCLYLSKCCYLCWDCCTDPFWGCCPKCRRCEDCLLLRCGGKQQADSDDRYYEVSVMQQQKQQTAEEEEKDVLIENGKHKPTIKSTSSNKDKTEVISYYNQDDDDDVAAGANESLPQVYGTYYFNVLHLFKGGRCEYDLANSREEEESPHELSVISNGGDPAKVVLQKNDIVIEHGHAGRYQSLPADAAAHGSKGSQSSSSPQSANDSRGDYVSVQIRGGDERTMENGCSKRMSRSMESFGARNSNDARQNGQNGGSSGGGHSRNHLDTISVKCHKYSQTDLHLEDVAIIVESNGHSSFVRNKAENGHSGTMESGKVAVIGRRERSPTPPTKCPLPRVPRLSREESRKAQKMENGSNVMLEKEILFGKETNILI